MAARYYQGVAWAYGKTVADDEGVVVSGDEAFAWERAERAGVGGAGGSQDGKVAAVRLMDFTANFRLFIKLNFNQVARFAETDNSRHEIHSFVLLFEDILPVIFQELRLARIK